MLKKLYAKLKKFTKENYKQLIIYVLLLFFCLFRLPYYICTAGGTIDINSRIDVSNGYESRGSLNFAYVKELRATIPTYILSFIIPNWELIPLEDEKAMENENEKDILFRDKVLLDNASSMAVKVAFQKAGKDYIVKSQNYYVVFLDSQAETNIKIGDEIKKVNNQEVISLASISEEVNKYDLGTIVDLIVIRDNKEYNTSAKIYEYEGKKVLGLSIIAVDSYETNPDLKINFKSNESGPSGGFMLSLAIYNKLVKEDLTKGLKIVGTGTIDNAGNVGIIGGINYKLQAAVNNKADIFFAPSGENYDECIELQDKYDYDIEIIEVKNIDDAINYLHNYHQN